MTRGKRKLSEHFCPMLVSRFAYQRALMTAERQSISACDWVSQLILRVTTHNRKLTVQRSKK